MTTPTAFGGCVWVSMGTLLRLASLRINLYKSMHEYILALVDACTKSMTWILMKMREDA
jgi:hypothetical protein